MITTFQAFTSIFDYSVQSGGYAITCERSNHNIESIGWNVHFSTDGIRFMQTILWARVRIPGYFFTAVKN